MGRRGRTQRHDDGTRSVEKRRVGCDVEAGVTCREREGAPQKGTGNREPRWHRGLEIRLVLGCFLSAGDGLFCPHLHGRRDEDEQ